MALDAERAALQPQRPEQTVAMSAPAAASAPCQGAQHLALAILGVGTQLFAEGWKSEGERDQGRRERVSQGIEESSGACSHLFFSSLAPWQM